MQQYFSSKKLAEFFGDSSLQDRIAQLEADKLIPESSKYRVGALFRKGWSLDQIPVIAKELGYFNKFSGPRAITVFTTKGGVLKSTLTLNLARMAALHGIRTCVVGLDIQGDITTALGLERDFGDDENLEVLIDKINSTKGLFDLFNSRVRLNDIICSTDLANLFLIPETPELAALNDGLSNINRREFWLKEKIVDPLKEHFDLVIMDCSPNWNKLTTNALVASDALVSPLECKINNFRNFKVFNHFLSEFKDEMRIKFEQIFIPTKYSSNRRLSMEIKDWYQSNVEGCTTAGVRESVIGEEATALNKSIIEHAPGKSVAFEFIDLLKEIHPRIESAKQEVGCAISRPANGHFLGSDARFN